jgi:hypothetical protein
MVQRDHTAASRCPVIKTRIVSTEGGPPTLTIVEGEVSVGDTVSLAVSWATPAFVTGVTDKSITVKWNADDEERWWQLFELRDDGKFYAPGATLGVTVSRAT